MIRELYYQDRKMARALLDNFFKFRKDSRIYLNPLIRWNDMTIEDKKALFEESITVEDLYKLLDSRSIDNIKYFNIIDSNEGRYYVKSTSDLCMDISMLDVCFEAILKSPFFDQGVKINDFMLWGGKVSDDSVFYYINEKHTLEYSLDVDSLSEPRFELIPINNEVDDVYLDDSPESEATPEDISKDIENIEIKKNVGNFINSQNITDELTNFMDISNFKSVLYSNCKLFLLTLHDGSTSLSMLDADGNEMLNKNQIDILNKYYSGSKDIFVKFVSMIANSSNEEFVSTLLNDISMIDINLLDDAYNLIKC